MAYGKGLASINSSLVGALPDLRRFPFAPDYLQTITCVLAGSGSALTATSSGGAVRTGTFSDETIAIATEIAENEVIHQHIPNLTVYLLPLIRYCCNN